MINDSPACLSQCLGGDVRAAVDDFRQAKERAFRVLHGVNDVVAKRGLARLAAEIMISVAKLPGLKRLGVFRRKLIEVDVLQIRLGRGSEADARSLEELHGLARVAVNRAVRLVVDDKIEIERA